MTAWSPEVALAAVLAALAPTVARAADGLPVGEWRAVPTPSSVESALDASVDDAAAEVNVLVRPVARELLRRAARPCGSVRIWTEGEAIAVQCDEQVPAVAVPNHEPVAYTGRDGRTHSLVVEHGPHGLVQRFITPRGTRTNTFVLDGESLRVEVALDSPLLSRPLRYTIRYR